MGQKGNIAQLVEHCLCKAGAVGSNPTISTLLFNFLFFSPPGFRLGFASAVRKLCPFFALFVSALRTPAKMPKRSMPRRRWRNMRKFKKEVIFLSPGFRKALTPFNILFLGQREKAYGGDLGTQRR